MSEYTEKFEYFLSQFEGYLGINYETETAWKQAMEDYRYVFCFYDGRLPIERASERALAWLEQAESVMNVND
jgi:hypothetical protein